MRLLEAGPFFARNAVEADREGRAVAEALAATPRRGRAVEWARLPLLERAPLGVRLQSLSGHRAAAFGAPPGQCPAEAARSGATVAQAVTRALRACLAQTDARGRGGASGCGCVVLAADDALLAPPAALAYAPGVSARMLGAQTPRGLLIAEEHPAGEGRRMAFRDAGGVLGEAEITARGEVVLRLRGRVWRGAAAAFGRLRGRLVERWRLRDADDRRLTVLIGFEPGGLR